MKNIGKYSYGCSLKSAWLGHMGLVLIVFLVHASASSVSAYLFKSDFTGPNDVNIASLPEWSAVNYFQGDPCQPGYDPNAFSTRTIDNNMGKFAMRMNDSIYSAIRANTLFNPIDPNGLRFQYTISKITELNWAWNTSASSALCLSNRNDWYGSAWANRGEKFYWSALWNKQLSTLGLEFRIINYSDAEPNHYDVGKIIFSTTVDGAVMNSGAQLKLCLELRNHGGSDVRVGYQYGLNGVWAPGPTRHGLTPLMRADLLGLTLPVIFQHLTPTGKPGGLPTPLFIRSSTVLIFVRVLCG